MHLPTVGLRKHQDSEISVAQRRVERHLEGTTRKRLGSRYCRCEHGEIRMFESRYETDRRRGEEHGKTWRTLGILRVWCHVLVRDMTSLVHLGHCWRRIDNNRVEQNLGRYRLNVQGKAAAALRRGSTNNVKTPK